MRCNEGDGNIDASSRLQFILLAFRTRQYFNDGKLYWMFSHVVRDREPVDDYPVDHRRCVEEEYGGIVK